MTVNQNSEITSVSESALYRKIKEVEMANGKPLKI
jgi:predicted DNA-binding transcriptional regulator AlpA